MSLKKILLVAFAALVVYGGLALPCQAQNTFKRRRPLRVIGQGFSDGYHKYNPGHDTSYYNPYSEHNSALVSQSPEYLAILAQQASQQPARRFFAGVPYSVYAAPSQSNSHSNSQFPPSPDVSGTFSPSVGSGLIDEDEPNSRNDFHGFGEDADSDDDNSFRGFGDDENGDDGDDDFREFGDEDEGMDTDDVDAMEEADAMDDVDEMDDIDMEDLKDEVDTSDELGGLSGLNHSLSLDNN